MNRALTIASLITLAALAACGGKSSSVAEPMAKPTPLAAGAWEAMSGKERAAFMKSAVMPAMAARFKEFDAAQKAAGAEEEFGEVNCKTCHGPGAEEGKFDMPSGALPELDFNAPHEPEDEAMWKFMGEVVKPEMATLLGLPEYSPENPTGFGCLQCHTMAKGE